MTLKGLVFNIERYAVSDGPGIRTLVFLKGCPLRCLWCSNPEGENYTKNLVYAAQDCIDCRECVKVCPLGAIHFNRHTFKIDRKRCDLCGSCVTQCYSQALQFDSTEMTVDEVISSVCDDLPFYRKSGAGGVTLSGGEPLFQWEFTLKILTAWKEKDIHTAMETSGFCKWEYFCRILPFLDYLFFDIKHMNPNVHRKLTGVDNRLILENLSKLSCYSLPVVVRMPVVPGYNDSIANVKEMARFVKTRGHVSHIELLPYHRLGVSKYKKLGKPYPLQKTKPPDPKRLEKLKQVIESEAVPCRIEE
ncbi:MAG: glycyl-radical enzyme activating protein [Deltaproteobacteria bacterium]|nr:glycyl-radical enzyme activating protein [Deltaproteobacteria bacterium]